MARVVRDAFPRLLCGALLFLSSAGCIAYSYERDLSGTLRPYDLSERLEAGRSTLAEALTLLGSPDLVLRVKQSGVNRVYYICSDTSAHRIVLTVYLPFAQNLPSVELAVLKFSHEKLWLVRIDAEPSGRLTVVERESTERYGSGQYYGISGAVVSTYLEDQEQAQLVQDESLEIDEDEDDELEEEERARGTDP